jgi:hypothetical protein
MELVTVAERSSAAAPSRPSAPVQAPPPPVSLPDTGLAAEALQDLLVKVLDVQGVRTGSELATTVALSFAIVDDLLLDLQQRRLVEVRGMTGPGREGYRFDLTGAGRERSRQALASCQYVGPAPVPLYQYCLWAEAQSVRQMLITGGRLREGFQHLVISPEVLDTLGPALNSGRSLFLYGDAGNGKTVIAEAIARLLGEGTVYVPYAVEVEGQIITLFDPVHHRPVAEDGRAVDTEGGRLFRTVDQTDRRFIRVARPVVTTGGELTLDQLDLRYDQHTRMYEGPFQLKANGGVLIIDDFGRQRVPPHELLNRWIVPLEKRHDYLTLHTGMKFAVPFDCLVIFATNLDPSQLVDEAFLRRIHYKVEVPNPSRAGYETIVRRECSSHGVAYEPAALDLLYDEYYEPLHIEPRACHPRDILDHLCDFARYFERDATLSPDLMRRACDSYFLVMAHDAMREAPARDDARVDGLSPKGDGNGNGKRTDER